MSLRMLKQFSGRIDFFEAFFGGPIFGNIRLWGLNFLYIMLLIASIGILRRSTWAKRTTILISSLIALVYIIHIPISINAALHFSRDVIPTKTIIIDCLTDFFIIFVFLFIIYFFTRPKIKEQFK